MSTTTWRRAVAIEPAGFAWLLVLAAVAGAFVYAYWPVMITLRSQWATNDTYSFGALVPLISAYLIWSCRDRLLSVPVRPDFVLGGSLLLASAALLGAGRTTAIVALQEIAMIATLAALILLIAGRRWLRALWFPVAYLLIMLPVWEAVTDPLHYPSQLFSAQLSERLLHALAVPVHRHDVYLDLAGITLEVASACSGINFLIAVLAIGVPQAYLRLQGFWPRATAIAFALAVALLSNGLRIAIIGWLASRGVGASLYGPGHLLQGLFVSGIGILAVLISIELLSFKYGQAAPAAPTPRRPIAAGPRMMWAGVVACAALILVGPDSWAAASAGSDRPPAVRLPAERWTVEAGGPARFLGPDLPELPVLRARNASGEAFDVVVTALGARRPDGGIQYRELTLPAGITESQVSWDEDSGTRRVNRVVITRGEQTSEVVYWYDLAGYGTPQRPLAKAYAAACGLGLPMREPLLVLIVGERHEGRTSALRLLVADLAAALRSGGS